MRIGNTPIGFVGGPVGCLGMIAVSIVLPVGSTVLLDLSSGDAGPEPHCQRMGVRHEEADPRRARDTLAAMISRTPCPECGQDWVRPYRFKDDGSPFYLCTECDSLWWSEQSVGAAHPDFVDDVVAGRLNIMGNPWVERVWEDVMEPVPQGD